MLTFLIEEHYYLDISLRSYDSFSSQHVLWMKVEMKSEALLKEHEVRRRDLLILKYDKQRSLCDEIILRQQKLIEGDIKYF